MEAPHSDDIILIISDEENQEFTNITHKGDILLHLDIVDSEIKKERRKLAEK